MTESALNIGNAVRRIAAEYGRQPDGRLIIRAYFVIILLTTPRSAYEKLFYERERNAGTSR